MKQFNEIVLFSAVVVGMLGGANLTMGADRSAENGNAGGQVHRPRDPFTDGGHNGTSAASFSSAANPHSQPDIGCPRWLTEQNAD